jgi:hypothetical protein
LENIKKRRKSSNKRASMQNQTTKEGQLGMFAGLIRDNGKLYYFNNPTCAYDEWERKQRLLLPYSFS